MPWTSEAAPSWGSFVGREELSSFVVTAAACWTCPVGMQRRVETSHVTEQLLVVCLASQSIRPVDCCLFAETSRILQASGQDHLSLAKVKSCQVQAVGHVKTTKELSTPLDHHHLAWHPPSPYIYIHIYIYNYIYIIDVNGIPELIGANPWAQLALTGKIQLSACPLGCAKSSRHCLRQKCFCLASYFKWCSHVAGVDDLCWRPQISNPCCDCC